jgi:subtilase family serine protease
MPQSKFKARSVIAPFVTSVTLVGALVAAVPVAAGATVSAGAAGPALGAPVPLTASTAPRLPAGAVRLGALAAGRKMAIEVALNVRDQAGLTAYLNGLADPASPYYQRFLAPGQFGPMFGASLAQVALVQRALRAAGLTPGPLAANRLSMPVTATAGAISRAFRITLTGYRLPGGRVAFANSAAPQVSASVAPLVQGVLGLNDLYLPRHQALTRGSAGVSLPRGRTATSAGAAGTPAAPAVNPGPKPCADASGSGGNTADIFAGYYGMAQRYEEGDFGAGIRVGVLELEPNLQSDITAYEQCYGIATPVKNIMIDGGAGTGPGQGEAALDIEVIAGLAPKSAIDVYDAPNNGNAPGQGFYDIFKRFVTGDTDKILSVSWGQCEAEVPAADQKALETLFQQANAQGQVIYVAAGDQGSTGCFTGNTTDTRVVPVYPATLPFATGVGGTGFTGSGAEVVWNESDLGEGATGGGVTAVWCMPAYQDRTKIPNVINPNSRADTASGCATKHFREVPDITADADPNTGYAVFVAGSWQPGGIGGTSAAAPLWASIAALTEASAFCTAYGSRGEMIPQNLYAAAAAFEPYIYQAKPQALRDITSGNNDYTPSGYTGGLFPARHGYDMASGLGAPMVSGLSGNHWLTFLAGLTQLLCHQSASRLKVVKVTGVSPNTGPHGKTRVVTVHGSGFLPIKNADRAQLIANKKVLTSFYITCTTTACKFTMPAEKIGTVDIRIFADSLWGSTLVKADRFRYT